MEEAQSGKLAAREEERSGAEGEGQGEEAAAVDFKEGRRSGSHRNRVKERIRIRAVAIAEKAFEAGRRDPEVWRRLSSSPVFRSGLR